MVERIADRAMDLRHATQRIRILDLVGRAMVGALETAVAEQVAELGRYGDLPGMRPGQLVRGRVGDISPEQGFERLCGRNARRADQPVRVGQEQGRERTHHLGPVEQGEALLRPELERFEPHLDERLGRR